MNDHTHLAVAVTLSMVMTFALHCVAQGTTASSSLFQYLHVDLMRDCLLAMRCDFNGHQGNKTCTNLVTHNEFLKAYFNAIVVLLVATMVLCYGRKILYYGYCVSFTICGVWLAARCFDGIYLWYNVDIFTVYLNAWQLMCISWQWYMHKLPWPFITFQQGSLCMIVAFLAFIVHDIYLRYIPVHWNFILLWLWSIEDIFACLHPRGRIRIPSQQMLTEEWPLDRSKSSWGIYYPCDLEDNERNPTHTCEILGLGDFFVFNFMLLLILCPWSSMRTKMCVALGFLIIVHISHESTFIIGKYCKEICMPGLPLPVAAVSVYAIILDVVAQN